MDKPFTLPELGNDAIFLPASQRQNKKSTHGCHNELYVLYYNNDADCGNGCFEIQILDKYIVNQLLLTVKDDYISFFDHLQMLCENKYIDRSHKDFDELFSLYNLADFIVSRDGNRKDEFHFIKKWALNS